MASLQGSLRESDLIEQERVRCGFLVYLIECAVQRQQNGEAAHDSLEFLDLAEAQRSTGSTGGIAVAKLFLHDRVQCPDRWIVRRFVRRTRIREPSHFLLERGHPAQVSHPRAIVSHGLTSSVGFGKGRRDTTAAGANVPGPGPP